MKKIPRAEISTIKGMLYPEKKKTQKEWNKKNLKCLKELEEKNKRIKEEKKNFISPEPYKIEKYKNIPSKLKEDTANWISNEQNKHTPLPKTANSGQKRSLSKPRPIQRNNGNTPIPIIKPLTSNNEVKSFINEATEQGEENIYNILNNKTVSMFEKYYASRQKAKNPTNIIIIDNNTNNTLNNNSNNYEINYNLNQNQENIFNQQNQIQENLLYIEQDQNQIQSYQNEINIDDQLKAKDQAIEKLINDYKQKYGTDEALENMINEYYGKNKPIEKNNKYQNKNNQNINYNNNYNNNDTRLVLPKIQKNYIRENRKMIIDNKIPLKHKQNEDNGIKNNKHKDYGKVPNYIKKYELEREIKKEEIKRQEEAAKYPKGTKLLTEEERLNTLNGLIDNKKLIMNQLEKMPITTRTNSVRIRKEELFNKLEEIEKAIDMFSKKQVFIKI